ncbi:MAG: hydrogenase maturation protease [Terriglobales bacterium]
MSFPPAQVLIIGFGNPLRSDDGFGCHTARELTTRLRGLNIEVLARQQLAPELAETASHFQLVIFIDAAVDLQPGTLLCEKITQTKTSRQWEASSFSHSLTPASLLACTSELYGRFPEAYCISVGGESFAEGESISPTMLAAFEPLLAQVRSLLALSPPKLSS